MSTTTPPRSFWPIGIAAFFVAAVTFLGIFITWSTRQREDLVADNYYENEVRYQEQLDRLNRTQTLATQIAVNYDAARRSIVIALPVAHAHGVSGSIHLYRPSDARLDRDVPLAIDAEGLQRLDARRLLVGLWKVRVKWNVGGEEFFFDQPVVVTSGQS
jgi:nitrogen fixation protein FixH